ncbi:MAG: ATP-binding protein [Chlamydiia bacterium]
MWIKRDFLQFLQLQKGKGLPVKVLRGPRQVGKTSLLHHLKTHKLILFDDLGIRSLAESNPSLFFDQFSGPVILDEATLAPQIFLEIKKRVDEERRHFQETGQPIELDIWITGSNQTLLQKTVRESLAGRAHYYSLNTLSIHEWESTFERKFLISDFFMKGGWPELYASADLNPVHYLNNFITTFIEKDIVSAAGIEKKGAFSKALQLISGRVGQMFNASDIAKNVGVDTTTLQNWIALFEQNGILKTLPPYFSNLNQRLIKTPKLYFEDIGLAVRLQGWSEFEPLLLSPYFGSLLENLALIEISRFFMNKGEPIEVYFVRSKEAVEIDFLLQLSNQRFIAIEVKTTPVDFTTQQIRLLESLELNVVDKWVVSNKKIHDFPHARVVCFDQIFDTLMDLSS